MTRDMRIAVWLFLTLNAIAVFLVLGAIEGVSDAFEGSAADKGNEYKDTAMREQKMLRLFERQVAALEESNDLLSRIDAGSKAFDVSNTIDLCEEGEGCPPRVIHVLEYMGAVATGDVPDRTMDCIADKYENGETWSLQEPMWGLSTGSDGDFSNMQVGGTLTHIWQCRDE